MSRPHRRLTFVKGSLGRFGKKHGILLDYKQVLPEVILRVQDHPGQRHYILRLRKDDRQFAVPYSQGSAIREDPNLERVLEGLAEDALIYHDYGSPEEFGMAFGVDPENWEDDFKTLKELTLGLRGLLGEEAFNELMFMAQQGFEMEGDSGWLKVRMCG